MMSGTILTDGRRTVKKAAPFNQRAAGLAPAVIHRLLTIG
jgi:hypothetical protein